MATKTPARLFFIVAREANVAVIFRRGPSAWTQIIKWNLDRDTFDQGQWFHGRIFEERCDLSFDGNLLVYFASKYGPKQTDSDISSTWTAVSKPPYLAAMGLWSNGGSTYGGGGLFTDAGTLVINQADTKGHPDFQIKRLRVLSMSNVECEYNTIFSCRLAANGWSRTQECKRKIGLPEIWERLNKKSGAVIVFENSISELKQEWKFYIKQNDQVNEIPNAQWADWDHNGRLVVAIDGKLFASDKAGLKPEAGKLKLLTDLNDNKPETFKAPGSATRQ